MMIVLNLTQIILLVLLAVRQQLTNNVDVYIDVYSGRGFRMPPPPPYFASDPPVFVYITGGGNYENNKCNLF